MNKLEAYRAMKNGHKITCAYFTPDEYLYIDPKNPSTVLTEKGYNMEHFKSPKYLPNVTWTMFK